MKYQIETNRKQGNTILSLPFKTVIRKGITLRIAYTGNNGGVCVVRHNDKKRMCIGLPNIERFLYSLT